MSPFLEASSLRGELRRSIAAFKPQDELERAHGAAILELLDAPGDICSRGHYVPGHLTASAFVLSPERSALLLIYHSKLERWLQPGGHLEPTDASFVDAARREVLEETTLDDLELLCDLFDLDVHEIPGRGCTPAHRHYDVRLLFRARTRSVRGASDALDARWFDSRQLSKVATDESVRRALRKLRLGSDGSAAADAGGGGSL